MTSRLFFNLLFSLSLSGTLLFCCWLSFHYFFKKKLPKRFQFLLLMVVTLRFLVPVTATKSLVRWLYVTFTSTSFYQAVFGVVNSPYSNAPIILGDNVIIGDNVVLGSINPYGNYLFAIWFLVFFFLLIQKITKYQSFSKYIRANWVAVDTPAALDMLSTICEEKKISTVIELYTTPLVSSPLLFGLGKSYIVLPDDPLTEKELYSILIHEVTHYQQKDLLFKWLVQLTVAIHWFNPLAYYLEKVVNTECEYACDEAATRHLTKSQRYDYGTTLIAMTKRAGNYNERGASVTLYENTSEVKKRLAVMLDRDQKKITSKLSLALVILLFLLLAFYIGAYYR